MGQGKESIRKLEGMANEPNQSEASCREMRPEREVSSDLWYHSCINWADSPDHGSIQWFVRKKRGD